MTTALLVAALLMGFLVHHIAWVCAGAGNSVWSVDERR